MNDIFVLETWLSVVVIFLNIMAIAMSGILAGKKARSIGGWIIGGFFLGWIAVIILACLEDLSVPKYYAADKTCPTCGDMLKYGMCGMCGYKDPNGHVPFYQKKSVAPQAPKRCPQCNEIMKSGACDMCGYKDETYRPVSKANISNRVEQKTIPPYQCASCGETINTTRCPYCGWEKK